ncbi:L-type lectin-domain containing receptor kinase IX.1-like [Nymphaea colorata]|uniref:non-specific serine/threonine protein kinase n=1 Tax=Nymphaea colorata TaxID=210225 RepID=A0A5K1GL34_9MAGN|nr:L-type lectin-domain containing receptor kinase IX.1-like [Nymphaea colorata]
MSQLRIFFPFFLLAFIPSSTGLTNTVSFPSFSDDDSRLKRFSDTKITNEGALELTSSTNQSGAAIYTEQITLYDSGTGFEADFTSNFSFQILPLTSTCTGDGFAFFIARPNWTLERDNNGRGLGVFNKSLDFVNSQIIAVEFDTYKNYFDPSANHMGIDVNSLNSSVTSNWTLDRTQSLNGTAVVRYNSRIGNLSPHLSYRNNTLDISHGINLTAVLPEKVVMGFSAASGSCGEAHLILNWNLSATAPAQTPTPAPSRTPNGSPIFTPSPTGTQHKTVIILVACLVPLLVIIVVIVLFVTRIRKQKRAKLKEEQGEEEEEEDQEGFVDITLNFETGPRRFRYRELAAATNDFSEEEKLGQGGFGGVYRGTLKDTNEVVAVKRFSKGSSQGKKEYMAEVSVISRLRHRNLVRLIGWCHERGEFLLVYEYLEGRSLDSHLFSKKDCAVLPWTQRRKVVLGLASAVLYLHEEWEQCVVHRDIKLSNVMVDSEFNARLGDFGLARLTNHGFGTRTTMVAGTMGYLAPECVFTGKYNTESDVYSFGVVLLEITTGGRAIRPIGEKEARLVEWIWEFYGLSSLTAAVDERLGSEFDQQEMERMMVVGLWCVHPDPERRPSMREAIRVLSFQAEMPSLPQRMPVPFYAPPPMNEFGSLFTSSSSGTTATSTTISSMESAEAALLRSQG